MLRLEIKVSPVDGILQRVLSEFSRRNLEIAEFMYRKYSNSGSIEIKSEGRAESVLKHLNRIYGVISVRAVQCEGVEREGSKSEISALEMLG